MAKHEYNKNNGINQKFAKFQRYSNLKLLFIKQ